MRRFALAAAALFALAGCATTPPPGPAPAVRNVEAGPIWNQADAEVKCPALAKKVGGAWTGQWVTTVAGEMSVCQIKDGRN